MTGEVDLAGVYVHPLLIAAILAFVAAEAIAWVLGRLRLYRFVWHRGLFDVALTILLWAGFAALLNGGDVAALFG
ncbi:hypothetical protein QE385_000491 [Sphingomonas sp. SORGH_AS 950]|uniref:DUF1656 domain-containing protein n=1 Tax=unclassified Sphingomonas TaxID=196159 RepID=UPI00278AB215|nr:MULTISPECIES: DUF1656 domain-containing protein [unclassified Sphingomonas]MDQ1156164.1 hypothetical protein [Sphingomonas sp. SORGH_AS_0950]MDR6146540.1 hypothetical protein [Sphingomonas sp. SORGH_AS_0870]